MTLNTLEQPLASSDDRQYELNGNELLTSLMNKIATNTATVGVIGLGYVGLPLAVHAAEAGFNIIGLDTDEQRVKRVNAGQSFISDLTDADLAPHVNQQKIIASTDSTLLNQVDIIVICVPTPMTKQKTPDITYIRQAADMIRDNMKRGQLVTLESTTYPGTTDEILLPAFESTGLKVGQDFFLAYSPERVDPGNSSFNTGNTNKVLGGTTPNCLRVAESFYRKFIIDIVPVSSTRAAEMVKIFENTFRAVNVALVNELALICDKMDLNVWEVVDAAGTKPFGMLTFYPGPGVGGHCIPIDPHYLSWKAKEYGINFRFVELAGDINDSMPQFVVDKLIKALGKRQKPLFGAKVMLLGLAYKKDVSDYRHSPAVSLIEKLQHHGADVAYHDPFIPVYEHTDGANLQSLALTENSLASSDCVIIMTAHSQFDPLFITEHSQLIMDTRNLCRSVPHQQDKVVLL